MPGDHSDDDARAQTVASGEPAAALDTLAVSETAMPAPRSSPGVVRRGADDHDALPVVTREHYRIDGEVARGGMGRILRARDRRIGRPVAVKELLGGGGGAMAARFEREAVITARLQHPAIVPVYEAGRWPDGEPFYVMKLVAGRPLDQVVDATRTFAERAALLPSVIAVCEALAYAHDHGVIHRDLKPGNVLVGEYGETVVIDWGLAKEVGELDVSPDAASEPEVGSLELTQAGSLLGTPAYMAPEQARGEAVDARADVYALGALLYHVLAGKMPYAGATTLEELLRRLLLGPPPGLAERAPEVPRELGAIVARAMAREPADRYASAGAMAADLRRFQAGQLVSAHRYTFGEMIRRWLRRHRTPVAVAALAAVALAIVGVIAFRQVVAARDLAVSRQAAVLEELGRQEMIAGHPGRAAPYLAAAWRNGRRTPSLRLLLGEAMWSLEDTVAVVDHGAPITEVFVAGDGKFATVGIDHVVRLWGPAGETGATLRGHDATVNDVQFTPDGALVATGSDDNLVQLWDVDGTRVATLEHGHGVVHARFVEDGRALLTIARDGVRLWDLPGGALRVGPLHPGASEARLVIRDGVSEMITIAGHDLQPSERFEDEISFAESPAVLRWDPATGASRGAFELGDAEWLFVGDTTVTFGTPAPPEPVSDVEEALEMPARPARTTTRTLDLATGALGEPYDAEGPQRYLRVPGGGHDILWDDTGLLWPDVEHDDWFRYVEHRGDDDPLDGEDTSEVAPIVAVDVLPALIDGRPTIALQETTSVALIDMETGLTLRELDGHAGAVTAVKVTADGATLVSGGDDGRAIVWRPRNKLRRSSAEDPSLHPPPPQYGRPGLSWAEDLHRDRLVLARAGDDGVLVWDLRVGRVLARIPGREPGFIAIDPSAGRIALGDAVGVRLWSIAGLPLATLAMRGITDLHWTPDGGRLLLSGDDDTLRAWDPAGTEVSVIATSDGPLASLVLSPVGGRVALASSDGVVRVVDLADPSRIITLVGHGDRAIALAFSSDGRTLLSGSLDGTCRLWDLAAARSLAVFESELEITSVAMRDDGALAAISTEGGTSLWDVRTGLRLASLSISTFSFDGALSPVWVVGDERRSPVALDAALARNRWHLDGDRLVSRATSRARAPDRGRTKSYDFSATEVDGEIQRPTDLRLGARAPQALQDAMAAIERGDPPAAARSASSLDGDSLADADELEVLAFACYYAGDLGGALRWARRAAERVEDERLAAFLSFVARLLVETDTGRDDAVAVMRSFARPGVPARIDLLAVALERGGRGDDAFAILESIDDAGAVRVERLMLQSRLAAMTQEPAIVADKLGAAWEAARGDEPLAASTLEVIAAEALLARDTYRKSRDRRFGEEALRLLQLVTGAGGAAAHPEIPAEARKVELELAEQSAGIYSDLDKQQIRRSVRRSLDAIRTCYERLLITDPTRTGTIGVEFVIASAGRVVDLTTTPRAGRIGLARVTGCVADQVRAWRFPRVSGNVHVMMPFELRPSYPARPR